MRSEHRLAMAGAVLAIAGGAGRVASAVIPYAPDSAALELLYAGIDVALVFGLLAAFLYAGDRIGWAGFAAFAVALVGLASIVGPDTIRFGIDFYALGATVTAVAMGVFAIALVASRQLLIAAMLWLLCLGLGLVGAMQWAGIAFGAGFIAAGLSILHKREGPRLVAEAPDRSPI